MGHNGTFQISRASESVNMPKVFLNGKPLSGIKFDKEYKVEGSKLINGNPFFQVYEYLQKREEEIGRGYSHQDYQDHLQDFCIVLNVKGVI